MSDAGAAAWSDMKAGIASALDDVAEAFETVTSRFKKAGDLMGRDAGGPIGLLSFLERDRTRSSSKMLFSL